MNPLSLLGGEQPDDELLVPTARSNLANIFSNLTTKTTSDENDSLKYTPPKHPDLNKAKEEPPLDSSEPQQTGPASKTSDCLIAKAVNAYELVNGSYEVRGKLGLAIMKMFNPPHTRVVLFTSNKTTISSATASHNLEVTVQNNNYITYYDETLKNWSLLFTNFQDLCDIVTELKKCYVKVNQTTENTNTPERTMQSDLIADITNSKKLENFQEENKEKSKDKISLINRMAIMGQSVLPRPQLHPACSRTSDSSDETTQQNEKSLPIRHKTLKTLAVARKLGNPKHEIEFSDNSSQDLNRNTQVTTIVPTASHPNRSQTIPMCSYINGQLIPVTNNEVHNGTLNVFLSETRASNSEVRININRLSDKVDQVLDKLKTADERRVEHIQTMDRSPSLNMDIFQKLLHEYEDKIRLKDSQIKLLEEKLMKGDALDNINHSAQQNKPQYTVNIKKNLEELNTSYEKKILDNEGLLIEVQKMRDNIVCKDDEIENLKQNISGLQVNIQNLKESSEMIEKLKAENTVLAEKNNHLQCELNSKEIKINDITLVHDKVCENLNEIEAKNSCLIDEIEKLKRRQTESGEYLDSEAKIKSLMNNTYKALAVQFEINVSYSGSTIRNIIASVIKQTTLDTLSSLQN